MIPALILILSAVAYRLAAGLLIHSGTTSLSNFAPLAAIALCGAAYFPSRFKFSIPLGAFFISDLFLNYYYGATLLQPHIVGRYLALALVGLIGLALQDRASFKTLLPASVLGSTVFYLITNSFSWLSDPGYVKNFGGFCHLSIGQEAVVVGAVAAVRDDDYIITAYRDHGHALARGTSANACMAELFGKATGCSQGLGGSMHFFDKKNHMYGGHAIVGSHVPLAAGRALASKYRADDRVTLCFFGVGAITQRSFHEALNLIALYKLPVVLICENNLFAMGTS